MSSEETRAFKDQDFEALSGEYSEDNLFEDPEFEASDSSLYFTQSPPDGIQWLRPKEACEDPKFVVDGFGRCDMDQGYIGNCWFIAGAVGIMQNEKLFAKVVPHDQGFSDNYNGMFHFRFWLYGEWIDVVVDDRLPYWPDGRLLYCSNKQQPNEYWSPLLEKAYAKIYGSYESLDAGQTYDALVDMSGGLQEQFSLQELSSENRDHFWTFVNEGFEKSAILGCSITPDPSVREAQMSNGLVRGHAYTITRVLEVNGEQMLRIRNPWGNEVEWRGAWSDESEEWNSISDEDKTDLGLVKEHDGEFWMNLQDFMSEWSHVQICHLTADSFSSELLERDNDADLFWKITQFHSEWSCGKGTAGGAGQGDPSKFWLNPQFLVTLTDVDSDDNENKATIIISLMQKDSRLKRMQTGENSCEEYIQFKLFRINDDVEVDENKTTGLRLYGGQVERIGSSGPYINSREVTKRFRVDPGNYLVIPSTYDEDRDSQFLIRTYTETQVEGDPLEEHKDELDEEDVHIEPSEDDNIMEYVSLLDPKNFKAAFSKWAKNAEFDFDRENNRVAYGDENARFSAGTEGGNHSFGAKIGGMDFGVGFGKEGFSFKSPWS